MVVAPSTAPVPTLGVQLRRGSRRCGWIRHYHAPYMRAILDTGRQIKGSVTSRVVFSWHGETCYWGTVEWYIVPEQVEQVEQ